MPSFRYYHIDAFAREALTGNQAAVMPMEAFLPDETLLAIAAENNFAETAYVVRTGDDSWDLRWFTPTLEVPLCGHATLASAHVLFNHEGFEGQTIHFDTRQSGRLSVSRLADGRLEMNFPSRPAGIVAEPDGLAAALGAKPFEVRAGPFVMAIFEDAQTIRDLTPDIAALEPISNGVTGDRGNVLCSAPGDDGFDVVSRFFAPGSGIDEDPATGSAHCMVSPVFSEKLGKPELKCLQAYPGRGGYVDTRLEGDRVLLRGHSTTVVEGVFHL